MHIDSGKKTKRGENDVNSAKVNKGSFHLSAHCHFSLAPVPHHQNCTMSTPTLNVSSITAAVAALKVGKLPTTDQLVAILQATLKSDLLQPEAGSHFAKRVGGGGKLSNQGREVVVAEREVIEAVIRIGLEKNDDDKVSSSLSPVPPASMLTVCRS